jgi:DNA invertase Pin-like site-specific DNA recombinase
MNAKTCFAYTRVSTVRQGDGVSLEAQRDAISIFARRNNLTVVNWFEEKESAAKRGRPVFDAVVKSLQAGNAAGLIVHKIDRSARNFSDWARVGELVDSGIDVHFAHESLDLRSRGGRLTADIQAVIAADYVRNLREECIKGMEGRLKQGLFPWAAPIGYLDQGGGKPKIPDPKRAPLVRQAYELYASGQYSFRALLPELQRRGLTTKNGVPVTKGCLENMMSNPFYIGTIIIKRTGRRYVGKHEPIVPAELFKCVQELKSCKQIKKSTLHNHPYRRLIKCGGCGRSLIGERQKNKVYYRCHSRDCSGVSIRQDAFERAVDCEFARFDLSQADHGRLKAKMHQWLKKQTEVADRQAIELQLANLDARLNRLTDLLIEELVDKPTFQERKYQLEVDRCALEKTLGENGNLDRNGETAEKYLELTKSPILLAKMANPQQRARLVKMAMSNCTLTGKSLYLEPQKWLCDRENTLFALCGAPGQDRTRTRDEIRQVLTELEK